MIKTIQLLMLAVMSITNVYGSESIKVVTEEWPPYNFLLPDGKIGGISTKVVHAVLKQSGLAYDIQIYPWARSFDMARHQPNVLIYSIFRSREREHLFKWICPLTQPVKLYLYALSKRTDLDINNIMDAKKHITGVTRGDYPHHYLVDLGFIEKKHLQISPYDNLNITKLLSGRIDLAIEADLTMKNILAKQGKSYSLVKPLMQIKANNSSPNCMAFGKNTSDAIVEKVRAALLKVNATRADMK